MQNTSFQLSKRCHNLHGKVKMLHYLNTRLLFNFEQIVHFTPIGPTVGRHAL